jgi:EpsI family protein
MAGISLVAEALRPRPHAASALADPQLEKLIPERFGAWEVDALSRPLVRPSDDHGRLVGAYDRLLERTFVDERGYRVMLSMAYLSSAFDGSSLQVHRPEVCYRYSGYMVEEPKSGLLDLPERSLPVTRLKAWMPGRIEPITYWVVVGNKVYGHHGELRRERIRAAMRREVLDGALIRLSSIDADRERAYRQHEQFGRQLAIALDAGRRPRVFGAASPDRSERL